MFTNFLKFIGNDDDNKISTAEEFLKIYQGQSFLDGLYRIHNFSEIAKWNDIVGKSFPKYLGKINVFAFDWLGRNYAIDSTENKLLLFEPGTGEVLGIPVEFIAFHNELIPKYPQDCLASDFFNDWRKANDNIVLPFNKCAGYKVPLFLNGKDIVENLEVSDMEVYWGIMMPLMNI